MPRELIEEVAQWIEQWKNLKKLVRKMGEEQREHLMRLRKELKG